MLALVRTPAVLTVCLSAVALAQSERRPENFQIALGLQQRGLHEEAAKYLSTFLQQQPRHALVAEAHYRLAQSQEALQQSSAAIRSLQAALQAGGGEFVLRPEAQYRLGNLLAAGREHRAALAQFTALTDEVEPKHYLVAAAHYGAGEAQRELGDDAAAAVRFLAAAESAVGDRAAFRFPSLYQLGFAQLRQRQYEPAAGSFTAALAAAPDNVAKAECHYLIGDAWLRLNRHDQAEQSFSAARSIGGDFADDAIYGLGWVALGRGDSAAAVQLFGELLQEHPQSPFVGTARLERARCFYQQQQFDRAERELEPLLANEHPLQQEASQLRGLCALASGKGQAAVDTLQRALASAAETDQPRLSFALGEALANLGRFEEAVKAYDRVPASVADELRGDALYGACHALHELKQHEQSIARANKVLAIEPPHRSRTLAKLAIAENWFALGAYDRAEPIYAELVKTAKQQRLAVWKLGWCRYLRGDKAAAAERFATTASTPDDANAEEALAMQALALLESDAGDAALAAADRYRARYRDGRFLDRTERVAARVLRRRGDLAAAQKRLASAAAAAAARDGEAAASGDIAEQAELAYQQGDYSSADELFGQLLERPDAAGARAAAGRAWCAFELGDDERCAQDLERAKQHPAVADELAGLLELESALRHRQQDWPKAIVVAADFLQRFPQHQHVANVQYALGCGAIAQRRARPGACGARASGQERRLQRAGSRVVRVRLVVSTIGR